MTTNQRNGNGPAPCRNINADSDAESAKSMAHVPVHTEGHTDRTPVDHTTTAVLMPEVLAEDAAFGYATRINAHLTHSVEACVKAGRELLAAKAQLPHGGFQGLFKPGVLRIDQRTAEMLMKIAEHAVLSNSNNYAILPAALNTLYQLSHLPDRSLRKAIENGRVTSTISIKEAKALVPKKHSKPAVFEPSTATSVVQPGSSAIPQPDIRQFCAENCKQTLALLEANPDKAAIFYAHFSFMLQKVKAFQRQKTAADSKQPTEGSPQPATK